MMTAATSAPLLSVLVPTYSYPDGVLRIMRALAASELGNQIEVLIADDSPDDGVEILVSSLQIEFSAAIKYRHNKPALGAAENWNSLLQEATGRYVWLLHHDEFPIGNEFLPNLVKALVAGSNADVLLLDCLLVDQSTGRNRQHLPMLLRELLVRHMPGYLFRRNAIGPTSCLIVRREIYPRFDTRLRWLVDVDVYAKLLSRNICICACRSLKVGSILGRQDSITARIAPHLVQLHKEELNLLLAESGSTSYAAWLRFAAKGSLLCRVLRGVETLMWTGLRFTTRLLAAMGFGGLPRPQVHEAAQGGQ